MPESRQASPPRLALASALVCGALLILRGVSVHEDAAQDHELRWSTQTPERAAQRFIAACASGQAALARALSAGRTSPCPALPRSLEPRTRFDESVVLGPNALRLRGRVQAQGRRHALDIELRREDRRWQVASARLGKR